MKNDTIDALLDNNSFLFSSLAELVNDEVKRIVNANLVSYKDLNSFVESDFKKAVLNKDMVALSKLHNTLRNIIFPTNLNVIAEDNKEKLPINNDTYKIEASNACCSNCENNKECCNSDKEAKLYEHLEKIAEMAGMNGKHEAAYIIEKFIKYNK